MSTGKCWAVCLLCALVIACRVKVSQCGDHPDGISQVSREQDAHGNYRFSYSVANHEGEQFRSEGTDHEGRVVGSYGLQHSDGTHRFVDYVADKDGFRASIRSNEPGLAGGESAGASVIKTDDHGPLNVAATSDDVSRRVYGRRLPTEASRVAYATPHEPEKVDEAPIEQRNFDDYRPFSPVAYYPNDLRGSAPTPSGIKRHVDVPRTSRVLPPSEEVDSRPLDVYLPPIDPHTALRRPAYFGPRAREPNRPPTPSSRPYIPPYGGFDDDPSPEDRKHETHEPPTRGGIDFRRTFPPSGPTPTYGGRRFPPRGIPDHSDIDSPDFPRRGFPTSSRIPGPPTSGGFPSYPHRETLPDMYNPPSYEGNGGSPNFVLRAVPIPNGIQAVKVDPNSGRIYERVVYPLFLGQDGQTGYDRNILLHNDDVPDDDGSRFEDSGYFDTQFSGRPYRGVRDQPSQGRREGLRRQNSSFAYSDNSLNEPTAKDMAWLGRQLALVEGFDRSQVSRLLPYVERSLKENDEFNSDHPHYGGRNSNSRIRSLSSPDEFENHPDRESFFRNPRNGDRLLVDNSNEQPITEVEGTPLETKTKEGSSAKDETSEA